MRRARHVDDRAVAEEPRHRRRVERGRHHEHAQIVAREPRLAHEREAEVRVDAAFVEFVEHYRRDVREQRILLQARGEDAFGHDDQRRPGGEPFLEADVPAHLAAERPAAFLGDARRHRAHGDAARLQHEHAAVLHERAGGTRVVLLAPGVATSTAARRAARASTTAGRWTSMGSGASINP